MGFFDWLSGRKREEEEKAELLGRKKEEEEKINLLWNYKAGGEVNSVAIGVPFFLSALFPFNSRSISKLEEKDLGTVMIRK